MPGAGAIRNVNMSKPKDEDRTRCGQTTEEGDGALAESSRGSCDGFWGVLDIEGNRPPRHQRKTPHPTRPARAVQSRLDAGTSSPISIRPITERPLVTGISVGSAITTGRVCLNRARA